MFEYSASNQVIQKITVPSNGSQYLIWRYQYDERGLKIKEAIYNKQKQLTGKIEYLYSFGS
jgi:YD repeat-containing protein